MDTKKLDLPSKVRPYDDSVWEKWHMYDNMPYVWNTDLNSDKRLTLQSGNIIKSYRCLIKEPYEVKH